MGGSDFLPLYPIHVVPTRFICIGIEKNKKIFGPHRLRPEKEKWRLCPYRAGADPGGPGAAGVFGVAVRGDVVIFSRGSFVCEGDYIGSTVLSNQIGVLISRKGAHRLVRSIGLPFVNNNFGGPQFFHCTGGSNVHFNPQGSAASGGC